MDATPTPIRELEEASLQRVPGVVVEATALYAAGRPAEAWQADRIDVALSLPLSDGAARAVAGQFRLSGIDAKVLPGGPVLRVLAVFDDTNAASLTRITFSIDDAEVDAARKRAGGRHGLMQPSRPASR